MKWLMGQLLVDQAKVERVRKMTATDTKEFMADVFKQATETFNHTLRTGVEFQEQAAKFWKDNFDKGFDQFRTQFEQVERMSKDAIPTSKHNLERFHQIFDEQAKVSIDMLRKSFETGENFNAQDVFDQTMRLWRNSFDTIRNNVDAMAKTNVEMLESFCEMAHQSCGANGHKPAQKPVAK
jgi:hypothetical protein